MEQVKQVEEFFCMRIIRCSIDPLDHGRPIEGVRLFVALRDEDVRDTVGTITAVDFPEDTEPEVKQYLLSLLGKRISTWEEPTRISTPGHHDPIVRVHEWSTIRNREREQAR